jgi:hypothetical protein
MSSPVTVVVLVIHGRAEGPDRSFGSTMLVGLGMVVRVVHELQVSFLWQAVRSDLVNLNAGRAPGNDKAEIEQ